MIWLPRLEVSSFRRYRKTAFTVLVLYVGACLIDLYLWKYWAEGINNPYAKYDKVRDALAQGKKTNIALNMNMVTGSTYSAQLDVTPLSGPSHSITVLCNEGYGLATYESDRFGFNNDDQLWDANSLEVAIVGDSIVEGACVRRTNNLTSVLNEQGFRSLNLGVARASPLANLGKIVEYLPTVKPKIVVLLYQDLADLYKELDHPILSRYYADPLFSQKLMSHPHLNDKAASQLVTKVMRAHLVRLNNSTAHVTNLIAVLKLFHIRRALNIISVNPLLSQDRRRDLCVPADEDLVDLFLSIVKQAHNTVAHWGGQLLIMKVPHWDRLILLSKCMRIDHSDNRFTDYPELGDKIRQEGIHFVDALKFFPVNGEEAKKYFAGSRPNHFSPLGYKLLGNGLAHTINDAFH
jgi:hypothetical protein